MDEAISPEQVSSEAALLPIHEIAAFLQQHLGQRMTAYIGGVNDPNAVRLSDATRRENRPYQIHTAHTRRLKQLLQKKSSDQERR